MFLPNCGTWHVASALRFIYVLHSLYQAYGLIERSSPTNLTLTTPQDTVLICALAPRASYTGLILARSSVRLSSRQPDTSSPTPCGHTEGTTHQLTHPPQTRNWQTCRLRPPKCSRTPCNRNQPLQPRGVNIAENDLALHKSFCQVSQCNARG